MTMIMMERPVPCNADRRWDFYYYSMALVEES